MSIVKGFLIIIGLVGVGSFVDGYINGSPAGTPIPKDTSAVVNEVPDEHRWGREKLLGDWRVGFKTIHMSVSTSGCLSTGGTLSLIDAMRNGAMSEKECKAYYRDMLKLVAQANVKYDNFMIANYTEDDAVYKRHGNDMFEVAQFFMGDAIGLGNRLGMTEAQQTAAYDAAFDKALVLYPAK